jgi:hypothetical protein
MPAQEAIVEGMNMWARRYLLVPLAIAVLFGCEGGGSGYTSLYSDARFYPDHWIYYDDDDEVFLTGLTDEQKNELKQKWDGLSPEEKDQIRDRWNRLSDDQRSQVRQAWDRLDLGQREQVISSMDARVRNGTLQPVFPIQPQPRPNSSFGGRDFGGRGFGGGRFGGGGFGGRR